MYCTRGCAKIGKESNFRGKKHTEQTKQKLKENALEKFKSKENHPRWLADRSKLRTQGGRRSSAYSIWRKEIYERDAFKCRIANNECSGRIEAHHILSYARYPSIRYEVNNGITLCKQHHPKTRDAETQLSPYFQDILKIKTH